MNKYIAYMIFTSKLLQNINFKYWPIVIFRFKTVSRFNLKRILFTASRHKNLNSDQLKIAYKYALQYKSFIKALIIRNRLVERLISEQESNDRLSIDAVKVAIECCDYLKVAGWLDQKNSGQLSWTMLSEIKAFNNLLQGFPQDWRVWTESIYNSNDRSANALILNGNVIFNGPAPGANIPDERIDDYGFLALINYTQKLNIHQKLIGKKIISYYNGQRLREDLPGILNGAENVSIIIPKEGSLKYFTGVSTEKSILRTMIKPKNIMYIDEEPNNFQNGLYDLIFLNAGKIFVTGFNFWCSRQAWVNDYMSTRQKNPTFLSESIRKHDPFVNYIFVKVLYQSGLIEVGNDVAQILNLSTKEYALILDELYPLILGEDYRTASRIKSSS